MPNIETTTYYQAIESYRPVDEQEVNDQARILAFLRTHPHDALLRENEIGHLTSSGFLMNEARDKILMIYHNIYQSWGWTGGHMDGDPDLLGVAIREAKEETGIQSLRLVGEGIASLDVLPVPSHHKRGKYVGVHLHLSVAYVFEVSETERLQMKPDENSGVEWFPLEELERRCTEPLMLPVYRKLIAYGKRHAHG